MFPGGHHVRQGVSAPRVPPGRPAGRPFEPTSPTKGPGVVDQRPSVPALGIRGETGLAAEGRGRRNRRRHWTGSMGSNG